MSPPMTGRWAMRVAMIGRRRFLTLPEAQRVRANRPRPWPTAPCQQLIQWSCRLLAPSTNENTRQGQHRQRGSFRSLRGWISSATLMPLQDAAMSHVVSRTRQLTGSILPSGKRAERAHLPKKSIHGARKPSASHFRAPSPASPTLLCAGHFGTAKPPLRPRCSLRGRPL